MPNNVTLTPKVMAGLVLFDLGGRLTVARNMSRAVTKEFAKPNYKVGDTVEVSKPYRFVGGYGLDWDPEALVDQVTPVTVNQVPRVHFQWDSVERTLDIREAMELYGEPVSLALASKINSAACAWAGNYALNSVGTPGTPATSPSTYLTAGDVLIELGLPENQPINLFLNRKLSSAFVNGTAGFFNPASKISAQYNQGEMLDALGYTRHRDQTITVRTNGTFAGTPLLNAAIAQQAEGGNNATMSLITDGWTSGGASLKLGDKFTIGSATSATIGGVNSVHPQTRQSTGRQQVFTVQAPISDTTGDMTMVIAPAITPSGQYQNVDSAGVNNAIITMIGTTAQTNMTQGLLMHKNAFAFVSVPLAAPAQGMGAKVAQETDDETGLTIRHTAYFDGDHSIEKHRYDCLIGFGNLYREMAVVVYG